MGIMKRIHPAENVLEEPLYIRLAEIMSKFVQKALNKNENDFTRNTVETIQSKLQRIDFEYHLDDYFDQADQLLTDDEKISYKSWIKAI